MGKSNLMNNLRDLAEMLEADAHQLDDMKKQNVEYKKQITHLEQQLKTVTGLFKNTPCFCHLGSICDKCNFLKSTTDPEVK